ncbi:toprim domain-containing protein [Megasphaera sp. SW808]|uniref:DnaB-like helicase C-terminal domain-containing protein n=1 Tax=Megasphaera sp. SW808 TaxID=2530045 RepID=UPI001438CB75|nr:DnaB-like helicase C-terminal domain-containing protein [Megasphaera sp. SW808]NJE34600.1 toprim domain-containing protein [Megasphaera sp. SW808]
MTEETNVAVKTHQPCPDCGSSDALTVYSDGHTYCFSCEATHHPSRTTAAEGKLIDAATLSISPLKRRGIMTSTCERYHYYVGRHNGKAVQVACYYDDTGELIGQKVRYPDKTFETLGKISKRFFGQELFSGRGKLVITEGEIDCLTVSQLQGNKYPVVSIPCGVTAAKKVISHNIEWLQQFDEIILMFDMDEPGRRAVKECAGLLKGIKVANLPMKDPNECLLANKGQAVINAIWNAKPYRPDGIVNGDELWDIIEKEEDTEGYPYPWDLPLNDMTMGLRKGELLVVTAGTGVGKTTFVRQLIYDLGIHQHLKIGCMMLEENIRRTALGIMSIHTGKRLHLQRHAISEADYRKAFEETLGTGRFVLYNHFGSIEGDNLLNQIRYLAVAEECDFIVLDHVSIAISGLEGDNERKLIDYLMTQMRSIVEETGVGMIVISHLSRPDKSQKAYEEGGITSLNQLRGSHAIAQLSDIVLGLERNQQDTDEDMRNTIKIRILKNRFSGETGIAGYLEYNKQTDRLEKSEGMKKNHGEAEAEF